MAGGRVLVAGAPAAKAARLVSPSEPIAVLGPPARFVSRGGHKLDAALDRFELEVSGKRALDAGASTGGFTDCLLQRGAEHVVALDVGHGQLDQRLRDDPRVTTAEKTNLRHVALRQLGGVAFPLLVADLSFISLTAVAPILLGSLAAPHADLVALVKPEFEAGPAEASRGKGVIRDPAVWRSVLGQVVTAYQRAGAAMMEGMVSPITGARGNVEFLLHMRLCSAERPAGHLSGHFACEPVDLDALVAEAVGQAEA